MEFNFKDALKLAIDNPDDLNNSNMCLISRNPFNSFNFIKLSCGHSFQYDILIHSLIKNKNYRNSKVLNTNIIKCPYCRHVINQKLPYIPELVKKKYYGINFHNSQAPDFPHPNKCIYIQKNKKICNKHCLNEYCKKHFSSVNNNSLEKNTLKELKIMAKQLGLKRYSKLNKKDLINLINENKNI